MQEGRRECQLHIAYTSNKIRNIYANDKIQYVIHIANTNYMIQYNDYNMIQISYANRNCQEI